MTGMKWKLNIIWVSESIMQRAFLLPDQYYQNQFLSLSCLLFTYTRENRLFPFWQHPVTHMNLSVLATILSSFCVYFLKQMIIQKRPFSPLCTGYSVMDSANAGVAHTQLHWSRIWSTYYWCLHLYSSTWGFVSVSVANHSLQRFITRP